MGTLPALVHAHPADTVRDAIAMMTEFGVSQLPVLTAEPPVVIGEVVGAVDEESLLEIVFSGEVEMSDPVASRPAGRATADRRERVRRRAPARPSAASSALLVVDEGAPVSVVTRADLLSFLSR